MNDMNVKIYSNQHIILKEIVERGVFMSEKDQDLLKKLVTGDLVAQLGWTSNETFILWIYYHNINDFMEELIKIFGYGILSDGGFDGNMQEYQVAIDLCEVFSGYEEIEEIFSKDEYWY